MNDQSNGSNTQVTKILIAAIIVSLAALVWLIYAQVVSPQLAASVALDRQTCFASSEYCFSSPESWQIVEEQADDYDRLALENPEGTQLLSMAIGTVPGPEECDPREERPLHILSTESVDLVGEDVSQVWAVKAVVETAADGFFVPVIYLTDQAEHSQVGQLQTCAVEDANLIQLDDERSLITGIESHDATIGTVTPNFGSLSEAKEWLATPDAVVAYRVLSSLQQAAE